MNEQIIKKITAWINEEILSQKAGSSLLYWLTDTKFIKCSTFSSAHILFT